MKFSWKPESSASSIYRSSSLVAFCTISSVTGANTPVAPAAVFCVECCAAWSASTLLACADVCGALDAAVLEASLSVLVLVVCVCAASGDATNFSAELGTLV